MILGVVRGTVHIDAFEQHLDLRRRERHGASAVLDGGARGYGEGSLLQALRAEPEARPIPGDDLDAVLMLADEDEEVAGVRILAEGILDHGCQGGAALAHVGGLAGKEDAPGAAKGQHGALSRALMTLRSKPRSTPGRMRTATPRGKRISTAELANPDAGVDGPGAGSET